MCEGAELLSSALKLGLNYSRSLEKMAAQRPITREGNAKKSNVLLWGRSIVSCTASSALWDRCHLCSNSVIHAGFCITAWLKHNYYLLLHNYYNHRANLFLFRKNFCAIFLQRSTSVASISSTSPWGKRCSLTKASAAQVVLFSWANEIKWIAPFICFNQCIDYKTTITEDVWLLWLSGVVRLEEALTFCVGFASRACRATGEGEKEVRSAEGKVRNLRLTGWQVQALSCLSLRRESIAAQSLFNKLAGVLKAF